MRDQERCGYCRGRGWVDEPGNFLLARIMATVGENRWTSGRWIGASSNAMVVAAIEGGEPDEHPYDAGDLMRCLVTRAVAPESLHEAMDRILVRFRLQASEHHPSAIPDAEAGAAKHIPAVRQFVADVAAGRIHEPKEPTC